MSVIRPADCGVKSEGVCVCVEGEREGISPGVYLA